MKEYLLRVIEGLEAWAENPIVPFDRKTYNVGEYSLIGMGVLIDTFDNFQIISFDKLIELIDKGDASEMGMGRAPNISLILFANRIISQESEHELMAEALIIRDGKIIDPTEEDVSAPVFYSSLDPVTNIRHWESILEDKPSDAVNIEYLLSVLLSSNFYFTTFRNVIGFNLGDLVDSHIVDEIMGRLTLAHEKVINFNTPRVIH